MSLLLTGTGPPGTAWNPGQLSGLMATLLPAESLAAGMLWQNTAKTTPATADGDPVRVAVCPYTGVEFTAQSDAARPLLYDEGGGKWSLSYDGVDDRHDLTLTWPAVSAGSLSVRFRTPGSQARCPPVQTLPGALGDWFRYDGVRYADNFRSARADSYAVTTADTGPHTYTQQSGTGYGVWVDGVRLLTAAAAWQSPTGLRIAANTGISYLSGRISGAVFTAADWSELDRSNVETYLGAK